ncbi:MAG: T9SS type A sorting domain-containing protein [Candidatus Cloacimonadales bacterium]
MFKKVFFIIVTILIHLSPIWAVEVGGHLTENAVWSPENNPYVVSEILYIDSGVTLTILPGTVVKISGAPLTSWADFRESFWMNGPGVGVSVAKWIRVHGNIIAEGTAEAPITFTRLQDDDTYYWGIIYFDEDAEMCRFRHCQFEYSSGIGIAVGNMAWGAVSLDSQSGIFTDNFFINNCKSIIFRSGYTNNVLIKNNTFTFDSNMQAQFQVTFPMEYIRVTPNYRASPLHVPALIANNYFYGSGFGSFARGAYYVNNINRGNWIDNSSTENISFKIYFYNNDFGTYRSWSGISCGSNVDSLFIKSNRFMGGGQGIDTFGSHGAYLDINNNYFRSCRINVNAGSNNRGKIYNNIMDDVELLTGKHFLYYQNILKNYRSVNTAFFDYKAHNENNIFYNNSKLFSMKRDTLFTNCIFIGNDPLYAWTKSSRTDTFRNCIVDFPLEYPLIDGGGNIVVDSLQAEQIFVDLANGDFHLADNSIAIDAGFNTSDHYNPFDLDFGVREWDGTGDGNSVIDIGVYEYGAPQLGKISGYITENESNLPVDYVFIKINNKSDIFTFADSLGYYEIQLPEGNYTLHADRVFYDDVVVHNIDVTNETNTEVNFSMTDILQPVANEKDTIPALPNEIVTSNYPNPFNPETFINFSIKNAGKINLDIYNIRGQKVRSLLNENKDAGTHSVVWNGTDENKRNVASGVYLYKIRNGKFSLTKKMILMK